MIKCPGVRMLKSLGSFDIAQNGLKFRHASIWVINIVNSS